MKERMNTRRLILDLSLQSDWSGNDGISKENCSVSQVAAKIIELGKGSCDGKMDILASIPCDTRGSAPPRQEMA